MYMYFSVLMENLSSCKNFCKLAWIERILFCVLISWYCFNWFIGCDHFEKVEQVNFLTQIDENIT